MRRDHQLQFLDRLVGTQQGLDLADHVDLQLMPLAVIGQGPHGGDAGMFAESPRGRSQADPFTQLRPGAQNHGLVRQHLVGESELGIRGKGFGRELDRSVADRQPAALQLVTAAVIRLEHNGAVHVRGHGQPGVGVFKILVDKDILAGRQLK